MSDTVEKQKAPRVPSQPHMTEAEIGLFRRALHGCSRYLEFGAGGSTGFVLASGVTNIVSVESDPEWVSALRSMGPLADAIATGKLHLLHGDIGPVGKWGYPAGTANKSLWRQYPNAPWPVWEKLGAAPQLVLVDGRFRVACALRTALWFLTTGRGSDVNILCHDLGPERPGYESIFNWFDPIERVDTLAFARMKPDLTHESVAEAFEQAMTQAA